MPTALFQALIEQSDQLVFCLDKQGNFSYANPAFCHLLAYDLNEIKGLAFSNFIYPKSESENKRAVNVWLAGEQEGGSAELSIQNRNGVIFELEGRYSSQLKDKANHALLFTLSKKDIADVGLELLKEIEHTFSLLLENTEESFIMLDRSLKIVLLNKVAIQRSIMLMGKEFKVGDYILDYALPSRLEMLKKLYTGVLNGKRHESVSPIPQKDGSTLYYHIIYSPVRNRHNEIIGVFINTADITEKHKAETLLKNSESFYREFLESSSDIFILSDQEGIIKYASPSIERILGFDAKDVQGKNLLDFVQKDFIENAKSLLDKLIQQPQDILSAEVKLKTKTKKSVWVELDVQNKLDNPYLQSIKFTIRNIDARKKAYEEVQKKNLLIEGIANNINCIIFRFDSEGIIKDFFGKGLTVFSETGQEHIGKSMWDLLPDQMKKIQQAKDEVINYRTRGVRAGNYWAFENFIFREDSGNYLGFALDISDKEQQELKLIEYKERLETAQQIAKIGHWTWDIANDKLSWSPMVYDIFGLAENQFDNTFEGFLQKVHPEDRSALLEIRAQLGIGIREFHVRHRILLPDGKIKTVIEIAKLKTNSQGMPTSLDGVVQDLTSFVEKETLQLEKDLIQKATLSLITNESLRKGLQEIFVILEEYLGFDLAEALIGDELDENLIQKAVWHTRPETKVFSDSDEYPIYNTQKGLAVKAFRERKIIYEPNLAKSPYFLRKKEVAKAKLKEGIFVPILFKDKVICMFNFFYSKKPTKDYSELLEFFHYLASQIGGELQRKKVEEELNNFFNLSNDLLCLIGFDGRLKRVNARFSNHLGYSKEALSNLNLIDIIHPKDRSLLESELHALRASNSTTTFECRVLKANTEPVWLSWSASSLLNDAIIFAIAHDISDNKSFEQKLQKLNRSLEQRAEELSHSNEQLERFAYIASHDLQEPLRMVSSFMQLLEQNYSEQLDSRAKQYIYYAVDGANRMKQLILDLLQYSRVGRESKIDEQVDIGAIMKEMEMIFREEIENGAKLSYGSFPILTGNGIMLRQLFQNLISNAFKYVKSPNPQVQIFYQQDESNHIIGIKDNGIGIDPKFFPKIFILFQRLHTKQDYSGTGIGLAICKKIVDMHKGKIWVESESGKGSTFWISIPKTF